MIYLDHAATAPVRPEVLQAMQQALAQLHGNPSSVHAAGRRARAAVEEARARVAALLGVLPEEIVFTSGGTEGDNLAVRGLALAARARAAVSSGRGPASGGHVISSPLEHPAVRGALAALEREDFAITWLPVDAAGGIDPQDLRAAIRADTVLVSLAAANHEIGNGYPLAALAATAREAGVLFHTDAVAAAGKIPLDMRAAGVDAATISAHKIEGPKGVGALFVRRGVDFDPLLAGGHQERERRPGTENLSGIVGFGVAALLAAAEMGDTGVRVASLRRRLERGLTAIAGARLHGDADPRRRLPGTCNVAFEGAAGQLIAIGLDLEGICVSTGAACTSGSLEPSPVLRALGLSADSAAEGVRITLGRTTTEAEIDRVLEVLPGIVARVRGGVEGGPRATVHVEMGAGAGQRRPRIAVAMSGGVDSSTAAALLLESGVDVVGVTLKLYNASGTSASIGGRCCGPRDIEDARATAALLGFPHYVINETETFRKAVIDDFIWQHRVGRTPNPCVRCNERLKFAPLVRFAEAIGADALATGHYARLAPHASEGPTESDGDHDRAGVAAPPRLLRAVDLDKDQSYFLFGVRPETFTKVLFPLGDKTKDQVRAIARRAGLPNADKPDSQQICFIPDGDHRKFVEAQGGAGLPGTIVDEAGVALATHEGTHRFTIGQRRGVPAAGGDRRFVVRIDAASGKVVVGPRESLARVALRVSDVRWMRAHAPDTFPVRCAVQIRHHAAAMPAWIAAPGEGDGADAVTVQLDSPAHGVAPGQAAVFYDGEAVLGGGWID